MTKRDAMDVVKIAVTTLVAWLVPPSFWRKVAMARTRTARADRSWPVGRYFLEDEHKAEIDRISARYQSYNKELKLQILGLSGPWRSWRPDIHLNGTIYLRRALERGHGAILWVVDSVFSTLVVKMALHNAGYRACQLSRPTHGFSRSPFGIRFLNPIFTGVENRFIAERILIVADDTTEATRKLRERLAANRIVIIAAIPMAHRYAEVPFLRGHLKLPIGPIRLARTMNAALLPVFAYTKHDGGFEVSIDEALWRDSEEPDTESIAAAYAKRMESFVLEHPDQWTGWEYCPDDTDWLQQETKLSGSCLINRSL